MINYAKEEALILNGATRSFHQGKRKLLGGQKRERERVQVYLRRMGIL